jgi:Transposase DDE domain
VKIPRDVQEHARDVARPLADTEAFEQSRRERKRIEMRFAHVKRILKFGRLRLRGSRGAQDEFVLAAIAQNLPAARIAIRSTATHSGSVHRVALELRKERQGRRIIAGRS